MGVGRLRVGRLRVWLAFGCAAWRLQLAVPPAAALSRQPQPLNSTTTHESCTMLANSSSMNGLMLQGHVLTAHASAQVNQTPVDRANSKFKGKL